MEPEKRPIRDFLGVTSSPNLDPVVMRVSTAGTAGKMQRISSAFGGSITSALLGLRWAEPGLSADNSVGARSRFASRDAGGPHTRSNRIGFRVARTLELGDR